MIKTTIGIVLINPSDGDKNDFKIGIFIVKIANNKAKINDIVRHNNNLKTDSPKILYVFVSFNSEPKAFNVKEILGIT